MRTLLIVILAGYITGCATYPKDQFCKLTEQQILTLQKNLVGLQNKLNTKNIKYEPYITSEGYIFKQDGVCWVKLFPIDIRPEHSVLHGEIAVDVDIKDMSLGHISEIVY